MRLSFFNQCDVSHETKALKGLFTHNGALATGQWTPDDNFSVFFRSPFDATHNKQGPKYSNMYILFLPCILPLPPSATSLTPYCGTLEGLCELMKCRQSSGALIVAGNKRVKFRFQCVFVLLCHTFSLSVFQPLHAHAVSRCSNTACYWEGICCGSIFCLRLCQWGGGGGVLSDGGDSQRAERDSGNEKTGLRQHLSSSCWPALKTPGWRWTSLDPQPISPQCTPK